MSEVKVEQVDREIAATFYGKYLARPGEVPVEAAFRMGHVDESPLIQAFARHRIEATRAIMASAKLGRWMSAALDDPNVCDEMKADIREWFSAGEPVEGWVS